MTLSMEEAANNAVRNLAGGYTPTVETHNALPPQGGSVIAPPVHQHLYTITSSATAVVRMCGLCGKAWILPYNTAYDHFSRRWQEILEVGESSSPDETPTVAPPEATRPTGFGMKISSPPSSAEGKET